MVKHKMLLIIKTYVVLMMCFAYFWGENFTYFVHFKGDDVEVTLWFAILLTYALLISLYFNGIKFKGWLLLVLPIAITVLSFFTGFALLFATGLGGTPRQLTWLYLLPYTTFAILAVLIKMRSKRAEA